MRIWIRQCVCGGCRAQNLEILQLRGLQDLGTDRLWRRLLLGVCLSWLVWLYCPLTKPEYKEKEKIWRGWKQPCVLLRVFGDQRGHLRANVQSVVSKVHLTPVCLCSLMCPSPSVSMHFRQTDSITKSSGFWPSGQQDTMFLLYARHRGLLFTPASTPLSISSLLSL